MFDGVFWTESNMSKTCLYMFDALFIGPTGIKYVKPKYYFLLLNLGDVKCWSFTRLLELK